MQGARLILANARGKAALALLVAALLVRLLVPAGWMPMAGSGYAITLCTGMGAVTAWVDGDGKLHKGERGDSGSDQPCAFSGHSAALDLPSLGNITMLPVMATTTPILPAMFAVGLGRGLAAPPPPPTGPPASL